VAGFQVIMSGRFWVITEDDQICATFETAAVLGQRPQQVDAAGGLSSAEPRSELRQSEAE